MRTNKVFFLLATICSFLFNNVLAQNHVHKTNGDSIAATIVQTKLTKVRYLENDNPEMNVTISKVKDLKKITYEVEPQYHLNKGIPTSNISLNFIQANTVGDFSYSGAAKNAQGLVVNGDFYFKKNIGITGDFSLSTHPYLDNNEFNGSQVSINESEWQVITTLVGLVYSFKTEKIPFLTLDIKLKGGPLFLHAPEYEFRYFNQSTFTDNIIFNENVSYDLGSAVKFEIGTRLDFSKHLAINIFSSILAGRSTLKFTEVEEEGQFGIDFFENSRTKVEYAQNVMLFSVGLGIVYDWSRKKHY